MLNQTSCDYVVSVFHLALIYVSLSEKSEIPYLDVLLHYSVITVYIKTVLNIRFQSTENITQTPGPPSDFALILTRVACVKH